jgi:formate C-acetyltransferase
MTDRIKAYAEAVHSEDIYPAPVSVEYDRYDVLEPDCIKTALRLSKYFQSQPVLLDHDRRLLGCVRFDGSVPSNLFPRIGHKRFGEVCSEFYCKPAEKLCTFEWQHSTPNYALALENGFEGIIEKIEKSKAAHEGEPEKLEFLEALKIMSEGIIAWAERNADECERAAEKETDPSRKAELCEMARIIRKVPRKRPDSFREAVQTVAFCFHFLTDGLGTPDRYLYNFYMNDIKNGRLTREEAKELLEELYIMVQGYTSYTSMQHTRGGESHFAIGGYTPDGEDGYNELSDLIVDSLMEMPLFIPQISLRWTKKTPRAVLKKLMDCERKDTNKRIAFVSDENRIEAFVNRAGVAPKDAYNYTMVGCNEPALQGGIWLGGNTTNIARSLERMLAEGAEELKKCSNYTELMELYKKYLCEDLERILWYCDKFNYARSKDDNVLSSLLTNGCIESGKSVTRGGGLMLSGFNIMGMTCVIDSLAIIEQFVFDEKRVTMATLLDALAADWQGYDELRSEIFARGKFFGNSYEESDRIARDFTSAIGDYLKDKKGIFGQRYLVGCLTGYHPHYAWFGEMTMATPDGRHKGDAFMVGAGQALGKDREGLTALLSSVAQMDPENVLKGPFVCNVNIDSELMTNDENFEKTVDLFETYFKMGGIHFQLNYVTRETLLEARKNPESHSSLRVRVSGFSEYFCKLREEIQDDIIDRTDRKR